MKEKKKGTNFFSLFFPVLLLIVGFRGAWWVYTDTKSILESKNWQPTEAVITSTSIRTSIGGYSTKMYSPQLSYEFLHDGKIIEGKRLQIPSRRTSSETKVENILRQYKTGTKTKIYYDSLNPSNSVVIKPQFNFFFTFFLGIIAIGCLLGGIYLFSFSIKEQLR